MAAVSFKCPNCGGELIFDPATQQYKCEYCVSTFTQAELDAVQHMEGNELSDEPDAAETQEQEKEENIDAANAVMYRCPSCGAEIVTEQTTAATFCYYCHNPIVLSGKLEGNYTPEEIIPFAVTKEQAVKSFLDYVGKKKFVPKAFFDKKQIESMSGVYFPYWNIDGYYDGDMQAEGKKIRTWRTGDEEYTETKNYRITRKGKIIFKNRVENALKKANAKLIQGVMPYRIEEKKKFNMGYLSGFLAERRDIEQNELQKSIETELQGDAKTLLRESANGYNSVSVNSCNIKNPVLKWKYALLPVWTITYKGKDNKIYYYSMNGQTGKLYGELPVDYKKIALTSAVCGLIAFVLVLLGGYFA